MHARPNLTQNRADHGVKSSILQQHINKRIGKDDEENNLSPVNKA